MNRITFALLLVASVAVAFVSADVELKFASFHGYECKEGHFNGMPLRKHCEKMQAVKACENRCTSTKDCDAYVVDFDKNVCKMYDECTKKETDARMHLGKCSENCSNDICKIWKEDHGSWSSSDVDDAVEDIIDEAKLSNSAESDLEEFVETVLNDSHLGRKDLDRIGESLTKILKNAP